MQVASATIRGQILAVNSRRLSLCGAFLLLLLPSSQAVVINTDTGLGNTNAPIDDPGWANIGVLGGGSGIYLGGDWVLTAAHVGAGSITLGGISYSPLANTTVQLTNGAVGKTVYTDLIMFRLTATPAGLGSLTLMSSPPILGDSVTMIGAGRDRGTFSQWSLNTSTTPWTWSEVTSGGNAAGYKTVESRAMRWGTNDVSSPGLWLNDGVGDIRSFATTFSASGQADSEAQAVNGDSGGAVFFKRGTNWELGGVMLGVGGFSGQPDPATTPVFGNKTYSADLSFYAPQITSVIPEPSTVALLALSAAGWGFFALRRRG